MSETIDLKYVLSFYFTIWHYGVSYDPFKFVNTGKNANDTPLLLTVLSCLPRCNSDNYSVLSKTGQNVYSSELIHGYSSVHTL